MVFSRKKKDFPSNYASHELLLCSEFHKSNIEQKISEEKQRKNQLEVNSAYADRLVSLLTYSIALDRAGPRTIPLGEPC